MIAALRTNRRQRHVVSLVNLVVAGDRSPELLTVVISRLTPRPLRFCLRRPLPKRSRLPLPRPPSFFQRDRHLLDHPSLLLNDFRLLLGCSRQLLHQRFQLRHSTPQSLVEISVKTNGARAEITVADRGVGIAADEASRMAPFQQWRRAQREQQGLGLGFAIARRLLEFNGCSLAIAPRAGGGATVQLSLPIGEV